MSPSFAGGVFFACLLVPASLVFAGPAPAVITPSTGDECVEAFRTKVQHFIKQPVCVPPGYPAIINVRAIFKSLVQVNELSETVKVVVFLHFTWTDPRLAVTDTNCTGRKFNVQPAKNVWFPQYIVDNADQVLPHESWEKYSLKVNSDGFVNWLVALNVALECDMDIHLYPFDFQECFLSLRSPMYSFEEMNFVVEDSSRAILTWTHRMTVAAWRLDGQAITYLNHTPGLLFNFRITRNPRHYVVSVILPTVVINVLQLATFVLPTSSEEKMTAAFSCLLSYFLLYLAFDASVPVKFDRLPVITTFYAFITSTSLFMTLYTALIVRLDEWVRFKKLLMHPPAITAIPRRKQSRVSQQVAAMRSFSQQSEQAFDAPESNGNGGLIVIQEGVIATGGGNTAEAASQNGDAIASEQANTNNNHQTVLPPAKKALKKMAATLNGSRWWFSLPEWLNDIGLVLYALILTVSYILFGGYFVNQTARRRPTLNYTEPELFIGTFF